jgi:pyridoxal phosphate enzyme (YggS family)
LSLQDRIEQVEMLISAACERSGRSRESVNLIAVTKYVGIETAAAVIRQGYTRIGENRWQDARAKWEAFGPQAEWHFIGHLQTNKVKDVIGKFAFVHSLDRLSLAQEINKKAAALGITVRCFIQLNVSGEETKYGMPPEELFSFAERLKDMESIEIVGLMTMAPFEAEPETVRPYFRRLRELRDELNDRRLFSYEVPHLSMGMSNDFEVAIEEGATWIRLGSILVGKE